MCSIALPLLVAFRIDLIYHCTERNTGRTARIRLSLKPTSIQIGNEDESFLCAARIDEIFMPNLLKPCSWLVA